MSKPPLFQNAPPMTRLSVAPRIDVEDETVKSLFVPEGYRVRWSER